jgi:hypothetical protein
MKLNKPKEVVKEKPLPSKLLQKASDLSSLALPL